MSVKVHVCLLSGCVGEWAHTTVYEWRSEESILLLPPCGSQEWSFSHQVEAAPFPAEPLSSVQLRWFPVCFYSLFLFIGSDIDFLFIVATEFLFKIVHLSFESVN